MTALVGTVFAVPQAASTDCSETSAIPTCGVSETTSTLIHHVLTNLLRLLVSPLQLLPWGAATSPASVPALMLSRLRLLDVSSVIVGLIWRFPCKLLPLLFVPLVLNCVMFVGCR
jgi:hypothetical protein